MKLNRKAAIEVSITAIIVMIIAIVVLTLVIGFIRGKFTQASGIVGGQLSEIQDKLQKEMTASGELLVMNMQENKLATGQPQDLVVGYHNTASNPNGDKVCFRLEVRCIKAFGEGNHCTRQGQDDVAVGGKDSQQNFNGQLVTKWYPLLQGEFDLKNYESKADPAQVLIRDAAPDTYSMEINLYKDPDNADCKNAHWSGTPRDMLYASKSFTLTVTST